MKLWTALVGIAGLGAGLIGQLKPPQSWTIIIGGDVLGYLSPCGCTYPMSGGIRRWSTAVRRLGVASKTIILENGGLVSNNGAQDQYKAQALVQALEAVKVTAINFGSAEARLGPDQLSQLTQLSGPKFVSTSVQGGKEIGLLPFVAKGPLLVGGAVSRPSTLSVFGHSVVSAVDAANNLVSQAEATNLVPVLMLDGDREKATEIAKAVPALRLIVFGQAGDPPSSASYVGKTMLVTPGEHGKFLVRLTYANRQFQEYGISDLGPSVSDDAEVSQIYSYYLRTVDSKNLIGSWLRKDSEQYAGTTKCGSCHQGALEVWSKSKHHGSYKDLQAQGHAKDPDCVVCHVTGLDSNQGFRDLVKTPDLGYVGCESCHGPGDKHSTNPSLFKLAKVGKDSCIKCHESENSPKFDFLTYWSQIRHH